MTAVHEAGRPVPSGATPALSTALKEGTAAAHARAEHSDFVRELVAGRLPLAAYTALVAQNHAIYVALEAAVDKCRDDPLTRPFVMPELVREPSLRHDLANLLGHAWQEHAGTLRRPATTDYVEHLDRVRTDPAAVIAHHYVRYLGDLSGGQILRAAIVRAYGSAVDDAVAFYRFDAIAKIKPFRDEYRRRLDATPFTPEQRGRVLAEAGTAFELNRAVFADLADAHGLPQS